MPKGSGKVKENPKATAAKEAKAQAKSAKEQAEAAKSEDQYWAEAGAGAKSKAQAKKDDQARQRDEAAQKKAEAKKLAAEEAAALASSSASASKSKAAAPKKVTSHQLNMQRENEQRLLEEAAKQKDKEQRREVDEDTYSSQLVGPNLNREDVGATATSVAEAVNLLTVGDVPPEDRHPERRLKAGHAAFVERELPALKQEKPGLRQRQYDELLFKMWQKSPENPLNRPPSRPPSR